MKPTQAGPRVVAGMIWAVLGCGWGVVGCRHVSPVPPDSGTSSFAFIEPPVAAPRASAAAEPREPVSMEQYEEASPITPLATPVYPPRALAAKVGRVTIGVKITVDATGRVSDIGPSLRAVTIPSRFDADFQEAVRAAVSQWRFSPALSYRLEDVPMPDGSTYQRMTDRRRVETTFDLSFTFTATGAVLGGGE
jgi:TonB family protein